VSKKGKQDEGIVDRGAFRVASGRKDHGADGYVAGWWNRLTLG